MKSSFKSLWSLSSLLALAALLVAARSATAQTVQGIVRVNQIAERVSLPNVATITTATTTLFATNVSRSTGRVLLRTVQNTGAVPILYSINTNSVTTGVYHGVLAGGLTTRDGLGSVLDLSCIPFPVYVRTESGSTTIAIVELTQ